MKTAILLAALASALLPGCAALRKADTPVTMRLSPVFAPRSDQISRTVAVAPVQARGLTGALRYAYIASDAPSEIRQASTYFWEEPPPRVLERALVAGLRTRFVSVSGPALGLATDRRVVATLTRFEEVGAGAQARAVVGFDASILADGRLVRSDSYCGTAPIDGAASTIRARAFEAAIRTAVDALAQTVASGDSAPGSSC